MSMKKSIFPIFSFALFTILFVSQIVMVNSNSPATNLQSNCQNTSNDNFSGNNPVNSGQSVEYYTNSRNLEIFGAVFNSVKIDFENCSNVDITNCTFNNSNIDLSDSNSILIQNCSIIQSNNSIVISNSRNVTITNNIFRTQYSPIDIYISSYISIYLNQFYSTAFSSDSSTINLNKYIVWDNGTIGNFYDNYQQINPNANFTFPQSLNRNSNSNEKVGIGNCSYSSDHYPFVLFPNEKPLISLLNCPANIYKSNRNVNILFGVKGLIKDVKIRGLNDAILYNSDIYFNGSKIFNLTVPSDPSMSISAGNWFGLSSEIPVSASFISQFSVIHPNNNSVFSKAPNFAFNFTEGSYSYLINKNIQSSNISDIWSMLKDSPISITISNSLLNTSKNIKIVKDTTPPSIQVDKINSSLSRVFISDKNYKETTVEYIPASASNNSDIISNSNSNTNMINPDGTSPFVTSSQNIIAQIINPQNDNPQNDNPQSINLESSQSNNINLVSSLENISRDYYLNFVNSTFFLNCANFTGLIIIKATDLANNTATIFINCYSYVSSLSAQQLELGGLAGIEILSLIISITTASIIVKSRKSRKSKYSKKLKKGGK